MIKDITTRLAELVAFPTLSAVSNLALLDHVESLVAPLGARLRRFPDPTGTKANLLVSIGPEVAGGLVFSGHTDVVPAAGQPWSGDPFTLRQMGDRLVGRGVTDMKGFLAVCLAVLPKLAALPLQVPVHLAFSYDEEVGCTGVWSMAEWVGQNLAPSLAIIGEPTLMEVVQAHKGGCIGWTHLRGLAGHSSQPERGANAVMHAAELVADICALQREFRSAQTLPIFDPPWSTIQVNQIEGGTHGNIIAQDAKFFWEMRLLPGMTSESVLARMQALAAQHRTQMQKVSPHCDIRIDVQARIPALAPLADAALLQAVLDLAGKSTAQAVSYGTEAGIFQGFGVPSVVIGPGSVVDAHQPDESIALDQLSTSADFLLRLTQARAL